MNVTVCQSCGMPLTSTEQFGTELDGSQTREYCIYCYKGGKFEQPGMTLEGMIEMCTTILKEEGMDEESARSMLRNQLPFLKRWRNAGNVGNGQDGTIANPPKDTSFSREPVRYVTLPGKRIAGLSARTTNAIEMSGQGSIGALWGRYFASEHIPATEAARYGCYTDYADGIAGEYTILVGHEVGEEERLPEGFDEVQLPPATYAVFTSRTGPMVEVVSEVWGAVWTWSHQSDRTFTGDFEYYDERSLNPEHAQVDVYIAVNERR
ncbi:zinc ribbon domain-containing protein [Paenibacillus sp. RRE4]|uniref:zinc ribbon domain-containing protein n=1 Tax=Paenibacillus sp. RRE4 TaxID=2962587 RepID=UPI002881C23E|nr:zinc ribbon domain-containing protein [Paenibacillus sp. RRE4]MDT0125613.1 zinc ribbon domain-containing protein [Paenibacillus sp. RRE4]